MRTRLSSGAACAGTEGWSPRRLALIALALTTLAGTVVHAAKPGGGGGGTGGGTIYFTTAGGPWSMNSDGTGKTPLPVGGVPSRLLHGGHRWFLQRQGVPGTYPDGRGRYEIVAVRGDGAVTRQLTDSPVVELFGTGGVPAVTWLPGDVGISEIGRLWDPDTGGDCQDPPYPQPNPCVVAAGIYSVDVAFNLVGDDILSLPADPGAPVVDLDLWVDTSWGTRPNAKFHDWSPDAAEVVHNRTNPAELKIVVVATGVSRLIATGGTDPRWSPDGSRISFTRYGIHTIAPDGTGLKEILSSSPTYSVAGARWSPTASHVTYWRYTGCGLGCWTGDVYRATATGGSRTNLTGDLPGDAAPSEWR